MLPGTGAKLGGEKEAAAHTRAYAHTPIHNTHIQARAANSIYALTHA